MESATKTKKSVRRIRRSASKTKPTAPKPATKLRLVQLVRNPEKTMKLKFGKRVRHVKDNGGTIWNLVPGRSSIIIEPTSSYAPKKKYSMVPQRMWTYNGVYLFDLGKNRYAYIGGLIHVFTALDPIRCFQVGIGNSAVRYAWATDAKKRYYLMGENAAIPFRPPYDSDGYFGLEDVKGGIKEDRVNEYDPFNWYTRLTHMQNKRTVAARFKKHGIKAITGRVFQ